MNQFGVGNNKTDYAKLLRFCGYGVPDLGRARHCAQNSLTLIVQDALQPFDKERGKGPTNKDMHLHVLPWPKEALLELMDTKITMRVTLSYFVEPSPGKVGWKHRYRYASHALRFHLINRGESRQEFEKRINLAAREDDEKAQTDSGSERWTIGVNGRNHGSMHSDIWEGTAADLAECNIIGITPVTGWWKERYWENRWNRPARYSLIVSIHTPEEEVDVYTPVMVQVGVPIETSF